ncbi:hypothetical protein G6011_00969 [Alternaria panax]|uniref:Heterokaryon incompatibility domain-containing protein n=1 Tax=Alternaria panax TaxID=48097 RepID=A0AAD4NVF8_9PLEO|nr:hypothetical protein G6011_00969 [Alternaria panax]
MDHYSLIREPGKGSLLTRDPRNLLDWTSKDHSHKEIYHHRREDSGSFLERAGSGESVNNEKHSDGHDIQSRDYRGNGSVSGRFEWGDYVALSYTWGDPAEKKGIIVNGEKVEVQANLEAALRALQQKKPTRSGYKVWVDALCINQGDFGERSREVRRMRLIYKIAADVVIWLGSEAEDSDKAMSLICILSRSCDDGTDKALGAKLRRDPGYLEPGAWLALSCLLERQYWNRMWIIQELCLGGANAPILCGQKSVTWKQFFTAIYPFGQHNTDVVFNCIDRERAVVDKKPFGLNRNRIIHIDKEHERQTGTGIPQYMCLLDIARKSDASDLKDKVYGILGLMPGSVTSLIDLDYSLSVEEVYTEFARSYIMGTQSLEILEQCQLSDTNMPSWAPDWKNKQHYRLFSGPHSTYHASGTSVASYCFKEDGRLLDVDGIMIDKVDGLGCAYLEYGTSAQLQDDIIPSDHSANAYGCDALFQDALWRTLTGDRTPEGDQAPDDYAEILNLPLRECYSNPLPSRGARAFSRFLTQSASFFVGGKTLGSFFVNRSDNFPKTQIDAVERVWRFTRTHRIMTTRKGRIGMIPHEACKGDLICVLFGLDVPVLLRPGRCRKDPLMLVGSAYVHGIMSGEGIQWIKDGLCEPETFSLR